MVIPHLMSVHVSVVHGGSGRRYGSISEAVENEQEPDPIDFAPQGGTSSGILVGPSTLSSVDNEYNGYVVVNMDTTPSFGLVCRHAVVTSYTGATRTFTLNTAVNFSAESTIRLIKPIHVNLDGDTSTSPTQETLSISKNIVINTSGFKISGGIDFSGTYCEVRGSGQITNGIQMTSMGVLVIEDMKISRRAGTIYSILMTSASNHGRCVISGSTINGRVSARRGYMGWEISGNRNYGVIDSNGNNIPYTLVESVPGVPITLEHLDIAVHGEFSGAFVYSENSITGTPIIRSHGNASLPTEDIFNIPVRTNRMFRYFWCGAGGSLALSPTLSQLNINLDYNGPQGASETNATQLASSVISFIETFNHVAPASCSISLLSSPVLKLGSFGLYSIGIISCTGTVTQTGNVTLSGASCNIKLSSTLSRFYIVDIAVPCDGSTISVSSTINISGDVGSFVSGIGFKSSQTVGAGPTVNISSNVTTTGTSVFVMSSQSMIVLNVSNGTYTVSGVWTVRGSQYPSLFYIFPSSLGITGGTYTISSRFLAEISATERLERYRIVEVNAAGGSFNISGIITYSGSGGASFHILSMFGGSATVNISSSDIRIKGFMFHAEAGYGGLVIDNRGVSSSGTLSGFVTFEDCFFSNVHMFGTLYMIAHTGGGGPGKSTTGPSQIEFVKCVVVPPLADFDNGPGTLTWTNSTIRFRNSILNDLLTLNGNYHSTVESMESQFLGNTSNKSIAMTGARPSTYRHWKCVRRALISDNLPEIIDDYEVRPSSGAISSGTICTLNSSGQATAAIAGTTYLAGVNLIDTSGVNQPAVIVRRGTIFVDSDGTVVAGAVCINNASGVPSNQIAGAPVVGRTVGIALEATGATRPGEAYTFVDLK